MHQFLVKCNSVSVCFSDTVGRKMCKVPKKLRCPFKFHFLNFIKTFFSHCNCYMSDIVFYFLERSGQQLQSRAVMVPGCGSLLLKAAGVLPTLCSLCEPPCNPQISVCRDEMALINSC